MRYFLFIFLIFNSYSTFARDIYSRTLQANENLHGDYQECVNVENKLGQLFFIFTDGVGTRPFKAINPEYIKVIKELGIGGIRLDANSHGPDEKKPSMEQINSSIRELREATTPPVLVSADSAQITPNGYFGLGTYSGFLGLGQHNPKECILKQAYLIAFLYKATNVNLALGPVIDPSNRDKKMPEYWGFLSTARPEKVAELAKPLLEDLRHFEVGATLKHFPYTPVFMNIHTQNENVPDSKEKVQEIVRAFKLLVTDPGYADFVMTTHLYNSNIDDTVATLSPKWIDMLKNDVGFKGIIVSDGLHMMDAFKGKDREQVFRRWKGTEASGISDDGIIAALSILKIISYKKRIDITKESSISVSLAGEAEKFLKDLSSHDKASDACDDDKRFTSIKAKIEAEIMSPEAGRNNERRVQSTPSN